ncbi:uncharacterized protein LOC127129628 [Lathyrus oleraceus]|uniref:uncharacterized protein LOC127129628 n=1 Tax=Pisum sativum TaxID=3888 RepID=UPI0021D121AA|nr:uncharacterized protein LOC127129628 [Pisum sativum]
MAVEAYVLNKEGYMAIGPEPPDKPVLAKGNVNMQRLDLLPVEIQVQAVRTQRQYEIPSEDYWSMMTDELVDLDEERMLALDSLRRQKEKVAKAYNKKVKGKMFVVDDLVWRVILPMDRNDRVLGKWSPNWEGLFKVLQAFSNNTHEIEELAPDRRILRVNGKYLKKYRPLLQEVKISTE